MRDLERLCPGCMRIVEDSESPCPYCGFDRGEYEKIRSYRALPPGTILAGKYFLGKVLGEGGFGITYLAWEMNLEVPVAVKEYFPSGLAMRDTHMSGERGRTVSIPGGEEGRQYQSYLRSFEQEARNLAKFQNLPGVVSVKDLFFENQTAYMAMEYIPGITMKQYLRSQGNRLDERTVLRLMRPALEALDKVHRGGIIHRDISPDNIMITPDQKVTLIDFGAARMASNNDGKSMTILLKHGYAPMEQYQSKGRQGPWTDVYAVCATIYRMISGRVPQEATSRGQNDPVKPLTMLAREMNFQVSRRVSDVVQKGMSVSALHRYQDVRSLIQELYEEPQTVRPPVGNDRPRNPSKPSNPPETAPKNYTGIILAVLGGLLAVLLILGAVLLLRGEEKSDDSQSTEISETSAEASPEAAAPVTAKLVDINQVDFTEYRQVRVASAEASSVIQQDNGAVNTPMMIFDENIETNWQEGVDGPGLGEWVEAKFSQESGIKYLTFKLGNWKTSRYYYGNNKPSKMTITVGEFSRQIEFPDEWTEFCLEFSRPCQADGVSMTIDEVYPGTDWDDTCITDMRVFAEE